MATTSKPVCKYGAKCYRRNAQHLAQYSHPEQSLSSSDNLPQQQAGCVLPIQQTKAREDETSSSRNKISKRAARNESDSQGLTVESEAPPKKREKVDEYFKQSERLDDALHLSTAISTAQSASTDSDIDDDDLVRLSESAERLAHTAASVQCSVPASVPVQQRDCATHCSAAHMLDTESSKRDHSRCTGEGQPSEESWSTEESRSTDKRGCTEKSQSAREQSTEGDQSTEDDQSTENLKDFIFSHFLVKMPDDFYEFWEFAKSLNPTNPSAALAPSLKLHLVGPFDVLAGKFHSPCKRSANDAKLKPNCLLHYRYYYDPPELMTVVKGDDDTLFHMGYFRDDPAEMPVFVASNSAAIDCLIKPRADNLFAAVSQYIDEQLKGGGGGPGARSKLTALQGSLGAWARSKGVPLEARSARMKAREKRVVAKSFHGAGIVVPVDKNDVGYRPLPESPADLKKLLRRITEGNSVEEREKASEALAEIVTFVQFANDECDYGEGLELGLDLFSFGDDALHQTIRGLLPLAYQLLGRSAFKDVIEAHLSDRRRGPNVSQLE